MSALTKSALVKNAFYRPADTLIKATGVGRAAMNMHDFPGLVPSSMSKYCGSKRGARTS